MPLKNSGLSGGMLLKNHTSRVAEPHYWFALVHLRGWDYFKALAQNWVMLTQSAADPSTMVKRIDRRKLKSAGARRRRRKTAMRALQREAASEGR